MMMTERNILEIDPQIEQETDVIEKNAAKNVKLDIEIDPEKGKGVLDHLAQIIEDTESNPAMGEGEGSAKRP